ncbi:hypothetical protein SAMN05192575_103357 [Nocardioides alpinus]|uniref:DUF4352 domain-containing protein n=1 Tax=Nocardioides alpinus TaxID=748909 RepID=A0A1I0YB17_9ACTN|nr:hypothetical protein [Nocardioides alpinus]PKH38962.1 hypothetical protein CXG46_14605 [Nocardioides alpinus]SFB09946.1 hypothetical protein SAMN05192575_103357 [Nocardioides alpinus]
MQPERRQLLKAGVWTLPVISVAVAAPAFATSNSNLATTTGVLSRDRGNPQPLTATLTIRNTGSGSTTALTATFTVVGLTAATAAPGWALTSIDLTTGVVVFTKSNAQLAGGPPTQVLTAGPFVLQRGALSGQATVGVDVDPGGGGIHAILSISD